MISVLLELKILAKNEKDKRMRLREIKFYTLFALSFVFIQLQAQEAISASGGKALGHSGSVSYTVGQIAYSSYSTGNYSVAQGVQQPYEISIESDPDQAYDIELSCSAYPNPVIDFLTLEIGNYVNENVSYSLYDVNVKTLTSGKIDKKKTSISMLDYVPATYYLKVVQESDGLMPRKTKVFKIIQNRRR